MRNIQSFIEGKVNMVGYRNIVEGYAINKDLSGFVYNKNENTVMLMAGGVESDISAFIQDLEAINSNKTKIRIIEINKNVVLPYPFGRVIGDEIQEMAERFDKGIGILGEMNVKLDILNKLDIKLDKLDKLDKIDNKLDKLDKLDKIDIKLDKLDKLDKIDIKLDKLDKLDTMNNSINTLGNKFDTMNNSINDNLNTLPERIAEAMKR